MVWNHEFYTVHKNAFLLFCKGRIDKKAKKCVVMEFLLNIHERFGVLFTATLSQLN